MPLSANSVVKEMRLFKLCIVIKRSLSLLIVVVFRGVRVKSAVLFEFMLQIARKELSALLLRMLVC
jgi:hypothetical protein